MSLRLEVHVRTLALTISIAALSSGCPTTAPDDARDANASDAGRPDAPITTDHCTYGALPATGHAGGTVTEAPVSAGTAEDFLHIPLGVTLGAYSSRVPGGGSDGFIDQRHTGIAGEFGPSVGIETWPRVRAVAISTGTAPGYEETIVLMKCDLALSNQAILRAVEDRLPPELAGKIVFATSHSHSSFANYVTDALQAAFGAFRQQVFDIIVDDMVNTIQRALDARRPALIGIAATTMFDTSDRVSRDRRGENDAVPGGDVDDRNAFLIRVDEPDGDPIAVIPLFGIHGTILGGDNMLVSTDSIGGIERVLEEHFPAVAGATPPLVMHYQGAGGDTSPGGLEGGTVTCPTDAVLCHDYARAETVGHFAEAELLALYDAAGADMRSSIRLEMVTRAVDRGPDQDNFIVRDGALRYAPWDGVTPADGRVYDEAGAIISPIDEFNAPWGAALCGAEGFSRALLREAQLPGTRGVDSLLSTPYPSCNRLEAAGPLFETALQVDFSGPPLCDTTRALLSAARIGDWYFVTIPGEPMVLLNRRIRELSPVPADHLMIIGYAQDHHGYVMTAEDWLLGGYEPNITFWGPLDGEQIMEDAVALIDAVMTDTREDTGTGTDHVVEPMPTERFTADPAPTAGTLPSPLPAYITNRLLPMVPTQANLPATARRLESVFFTFVGQDPLAGTPEVEIEVDLERDGTYEPLRRRSGRVVHDGDFIVTWTPDPPSGIDAPSRLHYWTVEWQLVPPLGNPDVPEADEVTARAGLPLGNYRIVAHGPDYDITSSVVDVLPAPLTATLSGTTLAVSYQSPLGFRLLDETTGVNGVVPVRSAPVDLTINYVGGSSEMRADVMLDAMGQATLTGLTGTVASVAVTDRFGNLGTATP